MTEIAIEMQKDWGKVMLSDLRLAPTGELGVKVQITTPAGVDEFFARVDLGENVVRFYRPRVIAGRQAAGFRIDPEAAAQLRQTRDALLAERERELAEWQAYVPATVTVLQGGDSHAWYVFCDREAPEGAPPNPTCQRLEEALAMAARAGRRLHDELERVGEVIPAPPNLFTFLSRAYRVPREALEALLGPEMARLQAARQKEAAAAEALAREVRELEQRGGALVALRRCWECGVADVVGRLDEAGRVRPLAPELRQRAEEALARAHARALRGAGEEPLAAIGLDPDPGLEFQFRVVETRYCGC